MRNHPLYALGLASAVSLLGGCAATSQTALNDRQMDWENPDLVVWIAGEKDDCRFASSPNGPWMNDLSKLESVEQSRSVVVHADDTASWVCIAGGIYRLQQSGLRVGFVSDPHD